jgi:16S rRNA (guanine527-N7)-methyltransferase
MMEILENSARKLGISFTKQQLDRFEIYYRELVEWNRRINLTAITGYGDVQTAHFLDSLSIILALKECQAGEVFKMIDIGAGAGFPGIPLRLVMPDISLVLLEATVKKAAFLKHIVEKLNLDNVEIITGRAEDLAQNNCYRERFEIVLSRAVAPLATLAELTLPFCKIGGFLIAPKKGDISQEIAVAKRAIATLGGQFREVIEIPLEEFSDSRCLVVIKKVRETPAKYPRRSGIPAKKPIS